MPESVRIDELAARRPGAMSDKRRDRIRLEISREACRMFWEQGVAATSGEQIADAVGLSVRTLWRYFRNKESCAEPVVADGVAWFLDMLRDWPRELSLDEHYRQVLAARAKAAGTTKVVHNVLLAQMIELGRTEPAVRPAWLMTCHEVERELAGIIGARLRRDAGRLDVRLHAAAATSAMRVVNEDLATALLGGAPDRSITRLVNRLPQAVADATGGAIGAAVRASLSPRAPGPVARRDRAPGAG
jgi:AcrR family transcriptional regulator